MIDLNMCFSGMAAGIFCGAVPALINMIISGLFHLMQG